MEVTYQLTLDDFREGIKSYRKKSALSRWAYRLGAAFVAVAICAGVALQLFEPNSSTWQNLMPFFALCVIWSLLLWVSPYLSARSQFRGSPSARAPVTLEVSDAGLHFRSQYTDSTVLWPTYVTWIEQKSIFALYPNPKLFLVIPKRAFDADQLQEFREMLQKKIRT